MENKIIFYITKYFLIVVYSFSVIGVVLPMLFSTNSDLAILFGILVLLVYILSIIKLLYKDVLNIIRRITE